MPEIAGMAIRIDFISAEFVHFLHMVYLSCVKYNLISYTHRIYSPQPLRNNQGPNSTQLKDIIRFTTRYATQVPCRGQTPVRHTGPGTAPGVHCTLPPGELRL